jgi:hypothetical protein
MMNIFPAEITRLFYLFGQVNFHFNSDSSPSRRNTENDTGTWGRGDLLASASGFGG